MAIHPLAGQLAPASVLIDVPALEQAYYTNRPDPANPLERVAFGTSGHRGTALDSTFTEAHILAITRAICDYRREQGSMVRFFSARIHMPFRARPSERPSRSWRPKASRRSCSATTA